MDKLVAPYEMIKSIIGEVNNRKKWLEVATMNSDRRYIADLTIDIRDYKRSAVKVLYFALQNNKDKFDAWFDEYMPIVEDIENLEARQYLYVTREQKGEYLKLHQEKEMNLYEADMKLYDDIERACNSEARELERFLRNVKQ